MKRMTAFFFAIMMVFSTVQIANLRAEEAVCPAGPLDGAWDWYTTLGKDGLEKEQILTKNKAERLQRCADKAAKEAGKALDGAAADAKKKLGF